jgi:hypothetical protein
MSVPKDFIVCRHYEMAYRTRTCRVCGDEFLYCPICATSHEGDWSICSNCETKDTKENDDER